MTLLSIPRLIKAGEKPSLNSDKKYLNLEEKLKEYLASHRMNKTAFLFKVSANRNEDSADFYINRTSDIIAEIAAIRPADILVNVIDKDFFEKHGGNNLKARICTLTNETEEGYMVEKIIRIEAVRVEVNK